jgi:hypothetical protein
VISWVENQPTRSLKGLMQRSFRRKLLSKQTGDFGRTSTVEWSGVSWVENLFERPYAEILSYYLVKGSWAVIPGSDDSHVM